MPRRRRSSRPSWYTDDDRRADDAARYGRRMTEQPLGHSAPLDAAGVPGGKGTFNLSDCPRCDYPMRDSRQMVKAANGRWIHKACANGADDE